MRARAAVVTGAGQGLGRRIAGRLARLGYVVHVTDVDGALAQEAVSEIGAESRASTLDVRDGDACRSVARRVVEDHGGLDLWVNNAGVLETGPIWQGEMDTWERVIDINLVGTLHGLAAALEVMRPAGRGHVVNIASLAGLVAVPGESVYAATKHGVLGLSQSTLADLRCEGISGIDISCICPDGMWTPMLHDRLTETEAAMSFSGVLLGPDEVAEVVENVVKRPRPVVSAPRWRGGLARVSALTPRLALRLLPAMRAVGRAQQHRFLTKGVPARR